MFGTLCPICRGWPANSIDHDIPLAYQLPDFSLPLNDPANMIWLCGTCQRSKGARTFKDFTGQTLHERFITWSATSTRGAESNDSTSGAGAAKTNAPSRRAPK